MPLNLIARTARRLPALPVVARAWVGQPGRGRLIRPRHRTGGESGARWGAWTRPRTPTGRGVAHGLASGVFNVKELK